MARTGSTRRSTHSETPTPKAPGRAETPPMAPIHLPVSKLREALELLHPAVPRKATLPAILNIRLGDGQAMATDLEIAISVELPEAQDAVLLPYKDIQQFLRYTPGHQAAVITREGKKVTINAGGSQADFNSEDPQDFPPLPQPPTEHEGAIPGDTLIRALSSALPYAATEASRPVLTGVALMLGDTPEVAAADGFRLAWEGLPGRLPGAGVIILPATAVKALEYLWKRAPAAPDLTRAEDSAGIAVAKRLIRLNWDAKQIHVQFARITLMARLLEGEFPNYRTLIPKEPGASVQFIAPDVWRALKQLSQMAKGSEVVRVEWTEEDLRLSSQDGDGQKVRVIVPAKSTTPGRTALKFSQFLEYTKGKEGTVQLACASESAPVVLTTQGIPNCCMMPMFVQWEDRG